MVRPINLSRYKRPTSSSTKTARKRATAAIAVVIRHGRKYGYVLQNNVSNNGPPNCTAGSENVPPMSGLLNGDVHSSDTLRQ